MQRFSIFTLLTATGLLWLGWQHQRAAAWQTENAPAQDVTSDADTPADSGEAIVEPPAPRSDVDPEVAAAAAAQLLRDARDQLYNRRSVQAKLTERSNIGNRRFTAEGTYVSGPFPQMRLEYTLRVGGSRGTLLEVCDGQILRTSKEIRPLETRGRGGAGSSSRDGGSADETDAPQIQVTRKNVGQILQAAPEGTSNAAILQAELGLGGIPTLLASLERTMVFDTLREDTWQGHQYTVIQGTWSAEYLAKIGAQLGQSSQAQMISNYMPERVRVYFDHDTLFPVRILYLKRASVNPVTYLAILSLEFTEVKLDQEIDPVVFRYIPPPGIDEVDETAGYVQMIKAIREQAAAEAEAATSAQAAPTAAESPAAQPVPDSDGAAAPVP